MANAYHDANHTRTLIAVKSDGLTLANVYASPSTNRLSTSNGTTGVDNGPGLSTHDANHTPILVATSRVDGKTPVVVYADAGNNLLVTTS